MVLIQIIHAKILVSFSHWGWEMKILMLAIGISMLGIGGVSAKTTPSLTISLPGQEQATYRGPWPLTSTGQLVNGVTVLIAQIDANGRPSEVYAEWSNLPTETSLLAAKVACTWQFHPRVVNGKPQPGVAKFPLSFDPNRPILLDFAHFPEQQDFVNNTILTVHATLAEAGPPPPPLPPPDDPTYQTWKDLPHIRCST